MTLLVLAALSVCIFVVIFGKIYKFIILFSFCILFTGGEVQNCNARYGAFKGDELLGNIQGYANSHILRSFQYLLMVTIHLIIYYQFHSYKSCFFFFDFFSHN